MKDSPEAISAYHSIVTWEKGHVRAAVIELGEGAAELMGVAAAAVHGIARTSHPDPDRWFAGCDKALTQAEDMTARAAGRKLVPDYVVMSVPVEVTHSFSVVVARSRKDPTDGITPDELRDLLQRGYRKAQDVAGTHAKGMSEDIIHGSVAEIVLDGQSIIDPLGLHGGNLELRLNFGLAPLEWIRTLEGVCERLQLRLAAIVPQHVAYASPLPDAATLLILLDEHHTSVSLARHGHIAWTALVERGEREIIGDTAEALDLRGRQADALMRAYRAAQLREEVERQLVTAFWRELKAWMTALARIVAQVTPKAPLPHRIYFLDMTARIPEAAKALETPFWEQVLPFGRGPEVIALDANSVHRVLDCTTQATGPGYLPLRTLAHYVAQLYAPGHNLERTLQHMLRWRRPATALRLRSI